MSRFAFVIHPISTRDVSRKYRWAKWLPNGVVEALMARKSPAKVSDIVGIRSKTGAELTGLFVGVPLTPNQMLRMPLERVYDSISTAIEIAAQDGAQIVGLGAFTAVVGDAGKTVAERSRIPVTTGNSYTVATAIEGLIKACGLVGIGTEASTLAVVGATGSIGRTCARVLAPSFGRTFVLGRDPERTQLVADETTNGIASTNFDVVRQADAIVSVTSTDAAVIEPSMLKPGSVVCDVARPRDVSVRVAQTRPDVLVIEGGVVRVPGDVDFGIDFGFPPKTAYACMSETMLLALEGRFESYTIGKDVADWQVLETQAMAVRHGFELAGFRSFEKAVGPEAIDRVREARLRSAVAQAV